MLLFPGDARGVPIGAAVVGGTGKRTWRRRALGRPTTCPLSSSFDEAAKRLDAPAVRAEIVPADARARTDVDHAAVEIELDVVDEAHQPRAELGIKVIRIVLDDPDARKLSQCAPHVRHRRAKGLD